VTAAEPEGLAHTLMELSRQAERLAAVDNREIEHFRQIAERLRALGTALTAVEGNLERQQTTLEALDGVRDKVTEVAAKLAKIVPDEDGEAKVYRPGPAPRWWKLQDEARDEALTKLRAWVDQIYRPLYGHLATLGPCWPNHPLCLLTLDWLSELWSVLYLRKYRTAGVLTSQAEFQLRLLPAAAEQLAIETARCEHAQPRNGQRMAARRAAS
jgi:hypothetical protein